MIQRWFHAADLEAERAHRAELNRPPPKNDPELFRLVRGRVLGAFCVKGQPVEPGTVCELEWHVANSLKATGKLELLQ